MNKDYQSNLEQYLSSMYQAKRMLQSGIISKKEYDEIDTVIAKKYGISSCSLYRGIDLIISVFRGNMSHNEEVIKCKEP